MKTKIIIILSLLAGLVACSKEKNERGALQASLFTVSDVHSKKNILRNEAANIEFSINRPQEYKGSYTLQFLQREGYGSGIVTYQNIQLMPGAVNALSTDHVLLVYTAVTFNYHRLDFTVTDENGQKTDFKVVFNPEKEGADDESFSASFTEYTPEIMRNEVIELELRLEKGILYKGDYYIRAEQKKGNGSGMLKLDQQVITKDQPCLLSDERVLLTYTAITKNYHELTVIVYDEDGREIKLSVVFNEDKKGIDDYAFTASLQLYQDHIQKNETVGLQIDIEPGLLYEGSYYLMYDQPRGQGFGVMSYDAVTLSERVPVLLTNPEAGLTLAYKAESRNYHQLDITIYDDDGLSVELTVIFNRDKKGIQDTGFEFTYPPYPPSFIVSTILTLKVEPIDLDYKGKYFIQIHPQTAVVPNFYLGKNLSGTFLNVYQDYPITRESDGCFYLFLYRGMVNSPKIIFDVVVRDEYGNSLKHTFSFN